MIKKDVINTLQERIYEWERKPNDKRSHFYGCSERVGDIIKNLKSSIEDLKEDDFPENMIIMYADLGIDATMPTSEHKIVYVQ